MAETVFNPYYNQYSTYLICLFVDSLRTTQTTCSMKKYHFPENFYPAIYGEFHHNYIYIHFTFNKETQRLKALKIVFNMKPVSHIK